jgi:hypothetical protein
VPKKHHTLLHLDSQTQATNSGSSVKNNQFVAFRQTQATNSGSSVKNNQSVKTKAVTSANVNIYTLKGKPRNHTLLATAIVEVRNKSGQYISCRALLDSGSQSHFITERCTHRLRLPRKQTTCINPRHFKCKHVHRAQCFTSFRFRHTDWHTTLDCAVLPNITGMTPATKFKYK